MKAQINQIFMEALVETVNSASLSEKDKESQRRLIVTLHKSVCDVLDTHREDLESLNEQIWLVANSLQNLSQR